MDGKPLALTRTRRILVYGAVLFLGVVLMREAGLRVNALSDLAEFRVIKWSRLERELTTPETGRQLLPAQIDAAIKLLKDAGALNYRLSDGVRADDFLAQRIEEGAWPVAFDAASPYVVSQEAEATSCTRLAAAQGVALDRCQ